MKKFEKIKIIIYSPHNYKSLKKKVKEIQNQRRFYNVYNLLITFKSKALYIK